jgi:hypothetical protein
MVLKRDWSLRGLTTSTRPWLTRVRNSRKAIGADILYRIWAMCGSVYEWSEECEADVIMKRER